MKTFPIRSTLLKTLLAAALLYLLMTGILSKLFGILERRMRHSDQR